MYICLRYVYGNVYENFLAVVTIRTIIKSAEINSQGKCNIKIRITHKRIPRYISTNFYIEPKFFDLDKGVVKQNHPNAVHINIELRKMLNDIELNLIPVEAKLNSMDVDAIIRHVSFDDANNSVDFFTFLNNKIKYLYDCKKNRTAELYQTTYNKLLKFNKVDRLDFSQVNIQFLKNFEAYMINEKLEINTRSIYFRNVRAVFNEAIDNDVIGLELYPFRKFKIKTEETRNRDLSVIQMRKLLGVELSGLEQMSRDVFMFSFYTVGMNLKDIFFLEGMRNKRIHYNRAKTRRAQNLLLQPEAMEIVSRYESDSPDFLLNFHIRYSDYNNFKKAVNKRLKTVAEKANVNEPLTSYYARHTWATIASDLGISEDTIRKALGHSVSKKNSLADVYINYNRKKIDEANRLVIDAIF